MKKTKKIYGEEINTGDIVQVNPKKHPDLAWAYFEIKKVNEIDQSSYIVREFELHLEKTKSKDKKIKKINKKMRQLIKEKKFKPEDLLLVLRSPRNEKI